MSWQFADRPASRIINAGKIAGTVRAAALHFCVSVTVTAVDRAESGLVHCGVGAGQDASPSSACNRGGKKEMAASDLVLTRSVELGYVQANSCVYIGCAAVSWKSMLFPDLSASSTGVRQARSFTPLSLSFSLAPPPPGHFPHRQSRENVAAQADLQGCQIQQSSSMPWFCILKSRILVFQELLCSVTSLLRTR
jgi:hypothetical protein